MHVDDYIKKLQKFPKAALEITRQDKEDSGKRRNYFKKGELFKKHPYIEAFPGVLLLPYDNLDVHGEYEVVEACYPGAEIVLQSCHSLIIDKKEVPIDVLWFKYANHIKAIAFDITEHMKYIDELTAELTKSEKKQEGEK